MNLLPKKPPSENFYQKKLIKIKVRRKTVGLFLTAHGSVYSVGTLYPQ